MFSLRVLAKTLAVLAFTAPVQAGPILRNIDKAPGDAAAGVAHFGLTQVAAKGGGAPRPSAPKSVTHSTPHHVVVHAPAVKNVVHQAVVHVQTRTFRKTTASHAKRNVSATANRPATSTTASSVGNTTPSYSTGSNYSRPNTYNGLYYGRYGTQPGGYGTQPGTSGSQPGTHGYRTSNYRRHHHHNQNVIRGIVESTTGPAENGIVQVKLLPSRNNRFRNNGQGAAVAANNGAKPKTAKLRDFQVNKSTHYQVLSGNPANFRNSSFKALKQGEPVLLLLKNGSSANLAQKIEMYPMNRQLAAKQQ